MEGSASQAGFYYQNNIAALKIIECLFFNSDIRQIRLENYEKGNHIDDIIIYRENKIDYFQVKWSEDEDNSYSLYNLLKSEINDKGKVVKKSLFKQLAEGYLSAKRNSEKFSIILFTTKKESNQKRPSEGLNHSLSDLRTNIFEPLKQSDVKYDSLTNYENYKETIEKIRQECLLDEVSFNEFIKSLEFKFSQEPIEQVQNVLKSKLEMIGIETSLFERLLNSTVKWSISGEDITKDLVLKELGILDRFEDKLSHYFKIIDDEYYVPNQPFFEQLERGLSELSGGYIFIEGLPGVGKSTALTKFKEQHRDITLAYYCFIPDVKNDFGEFRHQSYYFLKSLCIAVEKSFPEVDLPSKYSERYEEKLSSYIKKLSTLKKKIIFIIDGLDHVHRDTTLGGKSLLNYIKGDLPDNIYFILSSQYDTVLSPSVKLQIDSDARRYIKVSPFTQMEIKQYLDNKGIDTSNILDAIERVSGGIPIYLHYISELLIKIDKRDYEETLEDLPNLIDGKINSYHEYLFQKIEDNVFAKWVLAVLAYRKENTSVATIQEILKIAGENRTLTEVEGVICLFSHLLKQIDGRAYSIFHNSFREFIISKTNDLKAPFNKALVLFYEQNSFTDEAYRNYFSHLYEVGEYDKIISATTLEWVKSGWANYRSLEEIKENLEIALKATIEKSSLSEFIRIAFLKDQFEKLKWNFSGTEIDFTVLFLNVGETANSLRTIWDGDFILVNKEYFCYYLGKYYQKTGNLLPQNIINQGLSKSLKDRNSKSITQELKAEALIFDDIIELFNEIDSIKWQESNKHNRSYLKKSHSDEQNARINLKIKFEIINHLTEYKQYNKLFLLSKEFNTNQKLFQKIQIALIKCFLPIGTEKNLAIKIIKDTDFKNLSDKTYFKLISFCSDFLSDEEIVELFPNKTVPEPELFEEVIDRDGMRYTLRKEIINLYNYLKPVWIFQPELIPDLQLKVSYLSSPAEDIYNCIFILSDLWNKLRNNESDKNDSLKILKDCIESLYIKREKEFQTRAHGLFDMNNDDYFIAISIKHLFKDIFRFSTQILSKENLEKLVNYWITLDRSGDGFRHYSVGLTIASEIYKSQHKNFAELIYKVIAHAEEIARLEQDTNTLSSYLGDVSETYGSCDFKEDFKRIYNQLIDIAFGVGYRKDYQASDIIEPMELIHKIDPDNTLQRLSEVFHIQDLLNEAGNGRMQHICISNLIAFTADKYPELAFRLMEIEEPSIARDEAIDIIIGPLIENCSNDDLELYLAVIKTLPRWKNGGTSEAHFIHLTKKLLSRAIHFNNNDVITKIVDIVKFNTLVELEDIKELNKFSEILIEKAIDYAVYSLPEPVITNNEKSINNFPEQENIKKDKFIIQCSKLSFEELVQLFEESYGRFEAHIQSQFDIQTQNSRNQSLRKEYYSAKSIFESFYNETSPENKLIIEKNRYKIIREYIVLKNKIVHFNSDITFNFKDFKKLFDEFISNIDELLSSNSLRMYVDEKLDIEQFFENILHNVNWQRDILFYQVLSDKEVLSLVNQSSLLNIDNLLNFIEKWTKDRIRSTSLLKIANRLINIDVNKAKEIVLLASQFEFDSLLFQRNNDPDKLDFDIIETILKIDLEFGKKFLLNSYYMQKGKYSGDLTNSINKLIKYQDYFNDESIKAYYESNLQYNKELALGLPDKENKYEFIAQHSEVLSFSDVTIKHLVWLFNYPAIKIRELSLQSGFDLIKDNSDYIQTFIHFGIENGNDNEVEYSIIVLQAIALQNPTVLIQFKDKFLSLLKKEHFNILETTKELLLLINQNDTSFLSIDEIKDLQYLNITSPIILLDNNLKNRYKPKKFIYSSFQSDLLYELNENEINNSFFHKVYLDITSKGFEDYDVEKEGAIHRRYNINTNFDTIEIQSPYYDEVKSSLNKIFHSKIRRNCFEPSFVESIRSTFRVYDPSKLIYSIITRPDYINWIPENISKEDFLSFSDFDSLVNILINREEDYITLLEYGSQRVNRYKELNGTCYFEVRAFLKKRDFDLTKMDNLPFIQLENQYAYELPLAEYNSSTFPVNQIVPLIQISYNSFRGEQDLVNINLFSDIFLKFGIEEKNLLDIIINQDNLTLKAFRWINAYTSSTDRRRYKPSSEGLTFKIEKEILINYLKKNNLVLCYNVKLKRSADEYIPESYMNWYKLDRNIEIEL
ncbi:ATP-binding protein [Chryseobacterium sp. EO14]|uniref:ATP-binding protein n=1 Tax=Chryseobacterium sp. EO14 TaxID=2950551 RepID=UPI00210E6FA5|nr:ATP-binding protein [Chryseobacterium sp. EO14]MCQ4141889.1 ATP-binding protein [Chryseobacterium sp. EO14]